MIKLFFGLPRCGKTTLLTSLAKKAVKIRPVYSNVHLSLPNVHYFDARDLGKYDMSAGLILIDEATVNADGRKWKSMSDEFRNFLCLHGHYGCDIYFFTQRYSGVDVLIRNLTEELYRIIKPPIIGNIFSCYYRVKYDIDIPSKQRNKKENSSTLGEIKEGYCKPPLLNRIFCHYLYRKKYYKYFDSWEAPALPPLPDYNNNNIITK